jgi:hypothetical protein
VHVKIEVVWLVLGARGDVSRRVITVASLLFNEKIILTETLFLFL